MPTNHIPIADVKVKSNVRTEAYTSWKDSRWIIESEKLSALAIKLERRYNVKFVFADEELKENVFSGKLEGETLDQVLEAIKLTSPILYKVKNNTVYLSRNKMFNQKI
jgi:ferric-dicitrate binding protein FerR (iron transport regulator)